MANLASLPPCILHKILAKVATNHLPDFGSERIAFSGFNQIGREEYFYRSAYLFHLNDWIHEVNAIRTFRLNCYEFGNSEAIYMRGMYEFFVFHLLDEGSIHEVNAIRTFRLKCYEFGNPEAIYMRGMYEFFVLHLLDEGMEKINLAGERGFLLAKYVDGMLNLAISIDDRGSVHNYPSFTRAFADQMHNMMTSSVFSGHWSYQKHETFMSLLARIHPNLSNTCCCSRTPWRCDHCFCQCAA